MKKLLVLALAVPLAAAPAVPSASLDAGERALLAAAATPSLAGLRGGGPGDKTTLSTTEREVLSRAAQESDGLEELRGGGIGEILIVALAIAVLLVVLI